MQRIPSDAEWVDSRIAGLPLRWQKRLRGRWEKRSPIDFHAANVELREATAALLKVRLPLDATDAEICDAAEQQALRCMERISIAPDIQWARQSLERVCAGQGITPPPLEMADGPAVARMTCPKWWRRKLRKHQGQTVEAAAVRLGYVNRNRDLYVSEERLRARRQQKRRNAAALEATLATNEDGQTLTLAELASKSTANKTIRRAELMTRMSGFERYAEALGDVGLFITLTCPSRFHRCCQVNGGRHVIENPKYDPSETPRTAHEYLVALWAKARPALARAGVSPYGFRISEPQHDGTPHWHMVLFVAPDQVEALKATLRRYALQDSGEEAGAEQHRFDCKHIDKTKGSATAYVAKYVSKNIDGERVGRDLEGLPANESAERAEAWASNWRVRQFQQIGGPPVTVWRELRRIKQLPANAPEHLRAAHRAANKQVQRDGDERASVAWEDYCRAQGGAQCGRRAAIKLATRPADKPGQYGDLGQPRPIGVKTAAANSARSVQGCQGADRPHMLTVESDRKVWTVVPAAARQLACSELHAAMAKPMQPRTRVNNCTGAARQISRWHSPVNRQPLNSLPVVLQTCPKPAPLLHACLRLLPKDEFPDP